MVSAGGAAQTGWPDDTDAASSQCPNCGTLLLTEDHLGHFCITCGYPRRGPLFPLPALRVFLKRLLRRDPQADTGTLVELCSQFDLRWGTVELEPTPRIRVGVDAGPAIAVQEAVGSDKFLVVICGEVPWWPGLRAFFPVADLPGQVPATVRLRREATTRIDANGGLTLIDGGAGEFEVVGYLPSVAEPLAEPAAAGSVAAAGSEGTGSQPTPPAESPALALLVLSLIVGGLFFGLLTEPPSPLVLRARAPQRWMGHGNHAGALQVRTNCSALGKLDGAPPDGRRPSKLLEWSHREARTYRLEVICAGFQDQVRYVFLPAGVPTILRLTLVRREPGRSRIP